MIAKKLISLLLTISMLASSLCVFDLGNTAVLAQTDTSGSYDKSDYYDERIANFQAMYPKLEDIVADGIQISDKEFFGVWNKDSQSWEEEPQFVYDDGKYPGMGAIGEAVKAIADPDAENAYAECKELLLEYWREKYKSLNIQNETPTLSEETLASYEALMDNFIASSNNAVFGRINLPSDGDWVDIDIRTNFNGKRNTGSKYTFRYALAAARKDGRTAVIDSKESAYAPYIEADVNGVVKRFELEKDTYIKYGEPDVSFSDGPLMIEGSVNSIDFTPETVNDVTNLKNPMAAETKIAFLQFSNVATDGVKLEKTDVINSARLYVHGKWIDDGIDTETNMPTELPYKSVYIMPYTQGDMGQDLNTMTYSDFEEDTESSYLFHSLDGELYRRYDEDPVALSFSTKKNSLNVMGVGLNIPNLFKGYKATGDSAFVYHMLRVMFACINTAGTMERRLARDAFKDTNTVSIKSVAFYTQQDSWYTPLYLKDYIYDETYMTPEVFTIIMKNIYEGAEIAVKAWNQGEDINNWGGYNCQALQYYSMIFPEFSKAHASIEPPAKPQYPGSVQGGWIEVEKFRRAYKMQVDYPTDKNDCVEASLEYTYENLETLISLIEVADIVKVDPKPYYEGLEDELEAAVESFIARTNPQFGDWQTGDASPYSVNYPARFVKFLRLIDDNPVINYFITDRASGEEPSYLTYLNTEYPRVNFRNSWQDNAVAGLFNNLGGSFRYKRSHAHHDDLSLTVAAYGQYLLVDPMQHYYAENTSVQERWLSSTRGHNTIEINDTISMGPKYYNHNLGEEDLFGEKLYYPYQQNNKVEGVFHSDMSEVNTIYDFVRGQTFGYDYTKSSEDGEPVAHRSLNDSYEVLRDVLFARKGYFIVTDYINPRNDKEAINTYKQYWHVTNDANPSVDTQKGTFRTNLSGKPNVVVATVKDTDIKPVYLKPGLYTQNRSEFYQGTINEETGERSGTFYGAFEQNKAGVATFNTLIYPTDTGKNVDITTNKLNLNLADDKADAFEASIIDESGNTTSISYYTLFDKGLKALRAFGDYETDGAVALAEKTGDAYSLAVLKDGTSLKRSADDFYMVYTSDGNISDIGIEWKNREIYIASSDADIDFDKLTLYKGENLDSVYYNNEPIDFKTVGRYVYFGDNPVINDSYTPPQTQNPTPTTPTVPNNTTKPGTDNTPSGNTPGGSTPGGTVGGTTAGGGTAGGTTGGSTAGGSTVADKELQGHWAEKEIKELIAGGVIKGDDTGSLKLADSVTRAEFAVMIIRGLKLELAGYDGSFGDVQKGAWYADYIQTAKDFGLLSGDGTNAYPDREITREEMAKILIAAYELSYGAIESDAENATEFTDSQSISQWARDAINKASSKGLILGMGDGSFAPKGIAKREQAMIILHRLLNNTAK